jgi:hypothetical protein
MKIVKEHHNGEKTMRLFLQILMSILLILLVGCQQKTNTLNISPDKQSNSIVSDQDQTVDLYIKAFEAIISVDAALSDKMKYISLNFDNIESITGDQKEQINVYFKNKYNVETKNYSFKLLQENGFVKSGNYIEGVLLNIDHVDRKSANEVKISGSKFRSGTGADVLEVTLRIKDNKWIADTPRITAVS